MFMEVVEFENAIYVWTYYERPMVMGWVVCKFDSPLVDWSLRKQVVGYVEFRVNKMFSITFHNDKTSYLRPVKITLNKLIQLSGYDG